MLRTKHTTSGPLSAAKKEVAGAAPRYENGKGGSGGEARAAEWELRPGGMLVQKRIPDSDQTSGPPPPTIRVRVKYASTYHEIIISSQATFGELKKRLTGPTGLHHQDQKLFYKDKEKDSSAFLDMCGIKDKSKLLLVEDPISHEKRLLEMRKNAKIEKASKSISEISLEVDRLAGQVAALETIIAKGKKVAEKDVLTLIELLMNELLKLDGIMADGDAKLQRKMQVKRVQKYVETLDMIKVKYSMSFPQANGTHKPPQSQRKATSAYVHKLAPIQEQNQPRNSIDGSVPSPSPSPVMEMKSRQHSNDKSMASLPPLLDLQSTELDSPAKPQPEVEKQSTKHSNSATVVTTLWETFDSGPAITPVLTSSTPTNRQPQFPWDFYD